MFMRTVAAAMLASTPVLAADLAGPADWTGGFVGLNAGVLRSDGGASRGFYTGDPVTADVERKGLFPGSVDGTDSAAIGGVTLGYNRQRGALVGGVELDFALTNSDVRNGFAKRDTDPNYLFTNTVTGYETGLDNLATARLRAGYAVGSNLFYATGGLAAGKVDNRFSLELTQLGYNNAWSASDTRFGYVFGAGIERKVSSRFSVKAEVLRYDLSDTTVRASDPAVFPGASIDYKFDNAGVVARVGVNFGF